MDKISRKIRRKIKIRKNISGTSNVPRVSVFRSNRFIYAQAIDDQNSKTLACASGMKLKKSLTEQSEEVGKTLAGELTKKKISKIVFDRSGNKYHGSVKKLAETLRDNKINF